MRMCQVKSRASIRTMSSVCCNACHAMRLVSPTQATTQVHFEKRLEIFLSAPLKMESCFRPNQLENSCLLSRALSFTLAADCKSVVSSLCVQIQYPSDSRTLKYLSILALHLDAPQSLLTASAWTASRSFHHRTNVLTVAIFVTLSVFLALCLFQHVASRFRST